MTPDLVANLANPMLTAIRERLARAVAATDAAIAYGDVGDISRKIELALDVEVYTYEANVLLNALSLMNRIEKGA